MIKVQNKQKIEGRTNEMYNYNYTLFYKNDEAQMIIQLRIFIQVIYM